jgi:hypothetical protein
MGKCEEKEEITRSSGEDRNRERKNKKENCWHVQFLWN